MENQVDAHAENMSTMQLDQQITPFLKNLITAAEPHNQTPAYQQPAIFIQLQASAKSSAPEASNCRTKYISKHYSTIETSHISPKNFKNAYYNASTADLEISHRQARLQACHRPGKALVTSKLP